MIKWGYLMSYLYLENKKENEKRADNRFDRFIGSERDRRRFDCSSLGEKYDNSMDYGRLERGVMMQLKECISF